MTRERHKMRLLLPQQRIEQREDCRAVSTCDLIAVSRLMVDAYRGTIDDNGETLEDAIKMLQDTFAGGIGEFLEDCSFLIERDGQALACTLVTLWHDAPLLAEVLTHPSVQNQGLGAFLIKKSCTALRAHGYRDLTLFVTKGNLPAQHLYEKLGFQVVETFVSG
jgi:ribosomal protein S18 acetylase RimI-like enzyme